MGHKWVYNPYNDDHYCKYCKIFSGTLGRVHLKGHPMRVECFWWSKDYWHTDLDYLRESSRKT